MRTARNAVLIALAVASAGIADAQTSSPLEVLHVRGPVYVIFGAGANITVSVGPDGVLIVDTGNANQALAVLGAIRGLQKQLQDSADRRGLGFAAETRSTVIVERDALGPPKPIRFIINTHAHAENVGGNEVLSLAGRTLTGGNVAGDISDAGVGSLIFAHENVNVRLSAHPDGTPPPPVRSLPTDSYYGDSMKLSAFFNGEGVELLHVAAAHTDGDSLVWLRGSDVIAAGDIFSTESYPIVDIERGGNINGVVNGLNQLLDLAIPEFRSEGGTMIVPGHGRISDTADVAYYRDMVTIIRDRVQDAIKKGMTLDQVRKAKLTADYDGRYATKAWTPEMFIESVYRSLSQP